jgi:probable rRNA maturation factor
MRDGFESVSGDEDMCEVVVNPGDFDAVPAPVMRRAVLHVLRDAEITRGEVSVTCLDDDAIRAMNLTYLDRDRPTDVIAFSLGEPDGPVLGDIYLGIDQAGRQARELGISFSEEVVRLAIHGTLHVLGHDHPSGDERLESPMFALQERLLREVLSTE